MRARGLTTLFTVTEGYFSLLMVTNDSVSTKRNPETAGLRLGYESNVTYSPRVLPSAVEIF